MTHPDQNAAPSTLASRMGEAAAVAAMAQAGDHIARVIILVQVRDPAPGEEAGASIAAGHMEISPEALLRVARKHLSDLASHLRATP